MESKEDAEDAIDALNGKKIDGQYVKVEFAHPKDSPRNRDGYGYRDSGDRDRHGFGGSARFGDRCGERSYKSGGGRFDGGYSRNDRGGDRGGDRGYGRDREERRSERGGGYSRREGRDDRDRGSRSGY